ncbi:MAG: hypothetical protein DME44_12060 [Verrucomicrobia bacterium]|nr:MAG: hypothetical protein DME44_12060 [Verrucomicrobiota bacterium]
MRGIAGTGSASLHVLISHAACFTTSCCAKGEANGEHDGANNETLFSKDSSFGYCLTCAPLESKDAPITVETQMLDTILGALKWGVVGFVVTLFLMVMFEASRIHDDIPVPEFKRRHTRRTTIVLSIFAGILSGLVWLLVQRLD